jgi:esterase/lipase superfamily enzyme
VGAFKSRGRVAGRLRRLGVLVACLIGAGCGGPPRGLLAPVTPAPGSGSVAMLAATTRSPAEDPAVLFTGERGDTVSFASLDVSLPPGREPGTLQWPSVPADPARTFAVTDVRQLTKKDLPPWFRSHTGRARRVFVFVHGFNTSFDRAVFRFAQLAHDSDAQAAPVLFSWPSRGRIFDYKRDTDNASYSRSDLATLLEVAIASPEVGEITVLAHSLGSWVAVEAIRQLGLQHHGVPAKIQNLILASPDLDVGVFRRQVEDMGPRRPHITLFVSQTDQALRLSAFLTRGMTRLGAIDPTAEAYAAQLQGLKGVTVLDLSGLRSNDRLNHDLYAQSPEVVRLIGDRLIKGQVITEEDVDPGSAVEALGTAAGAVVTAPIRIFQAPALN